MKNIFLITELGERKASPGSILAWRDGGDIDSQKRKRVALARIFHPSLLRKPGRLMDAALELNFGLNGMYSYSSAPKFNSAWPHQPSRPPRHESYEISGLGKQINA